MLPQNLGSIYPLTPWYIPEVQNPQLHCCKYLETLENIVRQMQEGRPDGRDYCIGVGSPHSSCDMLLFKDTRMPCIC